MAGETNNLSASMMVVLMLLLAGLDLAGSVLAKEWSNGRGAWLFLGGAGSFLLLFAVFALGLRYAELSTVTFGWIVALQVAILMVERFRYDVSLPAGKWVAIVGIVCLQGYLILAPNGDSPADTIDADRRETISITS